jgi:hypothetical protein
MATRNLCWYNNAEFLFLLILFTLAQFNAYFNELQLLLLEGELIDEYYNMIHITSIAGVRFVFKNTFSRPSGYLTLGFSYRNESDAVKYS